MSEPTLATRYPQLNRNDHEWAQGTDYPKGAIAYSGDRLYCAPNGVKNATKPPDEEHPGWEDITENGVVGFRPIDRPDLAI